MLEISTWEIIRIVLVFLFALWPLLLIGALQGRRNVLNGMLVLWLLLALARGVLIFTPEPPLSLIIPEPLNTYLFLLAGGVLMILRLGLGWRRRKRSRKKVGGGGPRVQLWELSPREFEEMAVELFRAKGCRARRTGATGDHGVDVVAWDEHGEKWIAQCKRWRGRVGEREVRDLYGTLHHEKADKGVLFTSGTFTPQARAWAKGKPLFLCDGRQFLKAWEEVASEGQEGSLR